MDGIGLVLEGGGMRGVYTAGVLDCFMDQNWYFPYIAGVSAGACNATSYISRQRGRNRKVMIDYISDSRYLSYRNLWREKSIFGMDFIFNQLPRVLEPFDFDTFYASKQKFAIGTMDAHTGEAIYYMMHDLKEDTLPIIQASSSLPFVAQPVQYKGRTLFDGGLVDPIPIQRSVLDGNERHIIVLTKELGYRKSPFKQRWLANKIYPHYKGLVDVLVKRSEIYQHMMDIVDQLEREGKAFVIRPTSSIQVSRLERNPNKLKKLYELGYTDAQSMLHALREWMGPSERMAL